MRETKMEFLIGMALLVLLPLVIHARQRLDAAAGRRSADAGGGADVVIDPSASAGGDGGCSGCGGCGGCGG